MPSSSLRSADNVNSFLTSSIIHQSWSPPWQAHGHSPNPLDLISPMPKGKGQIKFDIVAINYFTKCVETEPFAAITEARVCSFIWKNIVCHFVLPRVIVIDEGHQFNNDRFREFCLNFNIFLRFSSSAHPRVNGQVEAINMIIKRTLKKKAGPKKRDWVELLCEV